MLNWSRLYYNLQIDIIIVIYNLLFIPIIFKKVELVALVMAIMYLFLSRWRYNSCVDC